MSNVQAIIVTWNKKKDVTHLLDQLKDIHYPKDKFAVLVVDNHSSDGTVQAIEDNFPWVRLIKNPENLGGAGGFNAGMRWTLGNRPDVDYLWLLDNDVLVDKNALKELVAVMDKTPQAGICGSKIMNRDNPQEFIEAGAFIDYAFGDIRRNMPSPEAIQDPKAVFEVDYVAACSLLARTTVIRDVGIWHEKFFIYWDDMEWGARFKSAGYKVLASNASVVFHPSWLGRTADNSAVWRNYYRTRNSLWFFNNYCAGIKRRLLLARMIIRFVRIARHTCFVYETSLSQAFLRGVNDFFDDSYGKKDFLLPFDDLEKHLACKNREICVFAADSGTAEAAKRFVLKLKKKYPKTKVLAILPTKDEHGWKTLCDKADRIAYTRLENGKIPWPDKYRMMKFLRNKSWEVLMTSHEVPRIGAIWGKDIARVDFEKGTAMTPIEKMSLKLMLRIPIAALSFLIQALFFPPQKSEDWEMRGGI